MVVSLLMAPAFAVAQEIVIEKITVESRQGESEIIQIQANSPIEPLKTFVLPKPDRVVIDLPRSTGGGKALTKTYNGSVIKGIRFGQFDAETSRLVIDVNVPTAIKTVNPGNPLTIELSPLAPVPTAKNAANRTPAPPPPAPKQLPLIVIDAGHGGQDPGALGLHKTHERDVTLNFARALKKSLIATGRYRAALTRDDDTFVMLHERVNIARRAKADLMISLHADSNPNPDAKGLSIYTLSSTASDAEAAALAEHENKADIITGIDLNTTDADVAGILIDLTQRETMNKSTLLADAIVEKMPSSINLLQKTHRFAGFRVLKAPDVPSVLIELGFLSNGADERLLLSPDYRDLVVTSVVKGVDQFYEQ